MKIGNREFKDRTYVMGILNVTPDSFSDGGKYNSVDRALSHAEEMIAQGADIIDIGGESTRPDYTQIKDNEEIERVVPIIEKIRAEFDIPLSIDTYKSAVAEEAAKAGIHMLNDIWGLKYDSRMAEIAAEYNLPICLMHNRKEAVYTDFVNDVTEDLRQSIDIGIRAGIKKENIILDPGVGFAKTYEQNLEIINNLEKLNVLGCPVLLGASRKSVIGLTLDLPPESRVEGTIATSVMAVMKGAMFVRVHDVRENKRAILMTEKIIGRW